MWFVLNRASVIDMHSREEHNFYLIFAIHTRSCTTANLDSSFVVYHGREVCTSIINFLGSQQAQHCNRLIWRRSAWGSLSQSDPVKLTRTQQCLSSHQIMQVFKALKSMYYHPFVQTEAVLRLQISHN